MRALPDELGETREELITGLACVECPGVVAVHPEGGSTVRLRFVCRVGHAFSADELIAGKERRLEERLWSVLLGAEELIALLEDLDRFAIGAASGRVSAHAERVRRLREQAKLVRELIESNEPVDLSGTKQRDAPGSSQRDGG